MWKAPTELPELKKYPYISIDIETYDPDLKEKGPGVRRGAHIMGISVGTPDNNAWYFPVAHNEGSLPIGKVFEWARYELCHEGQAKVGANIIYDLDFLYHAGIPVTPPFYDIQIAEALINENKREYNLNILAKEYLNESKESGLMEDFCREKKLKGKDPRKHIYLMPAHVVGPYAESDARLPLQIFYKQKEILERDGLLPLFYLESELTEVLLHMRRRGIRIDTDKAEEIADSVQKNLSKICRSLNDAAGSEVGLWNAAQIAVYLDKLNIPYPRTPKTNAPSITAPWLEAQTHPDIVPLKKGRQLDKFLGTFLRSQILGSEINGRIHAEYNQVRGDDKGTVTGRLSGSNPNTQFMPARDSDIGPLCRSLFLPDEGELWGRHDYSQIELRLLAHFAMGEGASEMRARYVNEPDIDFHELTASMAGCKRNDAKTINFGLVYGMGAGKLSLKLGLETEDAKEFINSYLKMLPFLKHTSNTAMEKAASRGYVKTILGRRRRFDMWEPAAFSLSKKHSFVTLEAAQEWQEKTFKETGKRERVKRAGTFRALNAVVQGSAADLMKKAMVDIHKAGCTKVLGYPLITVHDELGHSVPDTKEGKEAFNEVTRIMETCLVFRVPVLTDKKLGKHWGDCK